MVETLMTKQRHLLAIKFLILKVRSHYRLRLLTVPRWLDRTALRRPALLCRVYALVIRAESKHLRNLLYIKKLYCLNYTTQKNIEYTIIIIRAVCRLFLIVRLVVSRLVHTSRLACVQFVYMYVYIYIYTHTRALCVYMCMYLYIYIFFINLFIYWFMFVWPTPAGASALATRHSDIYIYIYIYIHIYIYIYTYIRIYIYT